MGLCRKWDGAKEEYGLQLNEPQRYLTGFKYHQMQAHAKYQLKVLQIPTRDCCVVFYARANATKWKLFSRDL